MMQLSLFPPTGGAFAPQPATVDAMLAYATGARSFPCPPSMTINREPLPAILPRQIPEPEIIPPAPRKAARGFKRIKATGYIGLIGTVEGMIRAQKSPYVGVDEAKKALFGDCCLKTFHFVVYSKTGDNWLIMCREPAGRRADMEEWQKTFGEGFVAVFAFERKSGIVFRTLEDIDVKLSDLL